MPGLLGSRLFQAFLRYYEPLRLPSPAAITLLPSAITLRLYPSPEWVSQVPSASFGARCSALPRKVWLLASVIFPGSSAGFSPSE